MVCNTKKQNYVRHKVIRKQQCFYIFFCRILDKFDERAAQVHGAYALKRQDRIIDAILF